MSDSTPNPVQAPLPRVGNEKPELIDHETPFRELQVARDVVVAAYEIGTHPVRYAVVATTATGDFLRTLAAMRCYPLPDSVFDECCRVARELFERPQAARSAGHPDSGEQR